MATASHQMDFSLVCHLVKIKKKVYYSSGTLVPCRTCMSCTSARRLAKSASRRAEWDSGTTSSRDMSGSSNTDSAWENTCKSPVKALTCIQTIAYTTLLRLCVLISLINSWVGSARGAQVNIYLNGTCQFRLSLYKSMRFKKILIVK